MYVYIVRCVYLVYVKKQGILDLVAEIKKFKTSLEIRHLVSWPLVNSQQWGSNHNLSSDSTPFSCRNALLDEKNQSQNESDEEVC